MYDSAGGNMMNASLRVARLRCFGKGCKGSEDQRQVPLTIRANYAQTHYALWKKSMVNTLAALALGFGVWCMP